MLRAQSLLNLPQMLPSPALFRTPNLAARALFHLPLQPRNGVFSTFHRFSSSPQNEGESTEQTHEEFSKGGPLKSGLYLVATPIGNLEDITLRALRVLRSADVILSEDTRHSGKLLQYYNIKTPLLSYHKYNESQRETSILKRLQGGNIVALISDAGSPGISDPGTELAKLCVKENIPVVPIPGPSALVAALSASGLSTDEFTFVGFLPKNAGLRRQKLMVSANETATQIFFVPPHKLHQFLEEASSVFNDSRQCVIAREMTKLHEEFWRGTLGEAIEEFSIRHPKGEITLLIEGNTNNTADIPSEAQLEHELRDTISSGHSLSMKADVYCFGVSYFPSCL
ncbi:tetrapyrrole (Corrin/Porphyrin) Methylase isoform X2 [Tasmannia lanceolata]|uniref:tetrapyrrole (Corrin/Porphyrin) Methylase isoform X2 n=1 Tax=Tasmannia lanceolata TaxID=3420 RepID=UPI004064B4EB